MKPLVASLVVVCLAAACSSAASQAPTSNAPASRGPTPSPSPIALTEFPVGFPTTFTNVVDPGPTLLTPVPGGLSHDFSGTLRAVDGTTGTYTATWIENRVPAGEVLCGGLTYPNLFTIEDLTITMEVTFPEWGHALLVTTNRVLVYQSSRNGSSPAACDEVLGGTYEFEFTSGPIRQFKNGTWSMDAEGQLVFDSPQASGSPSPSESPG